MKCCHILQCSVIMNSVNLIILVVCMAIARAEMEPRIFGGRNASDGQFPYQVSLRTRLLWQHICGGSIISSRFILSSAYCVKEISSWPMFLVAVIDSVHHSSGPTVKLDKVIQHEGWNRAQLTNDISLIRTAEEIIFSNNVQPIALPTENLPREYSSDSVRMG